MGLAALSGAFKRQGLGFKIVDNEIEFTFKGKVTDAISAARRTFGITNDEAHHLFLFQNDRGAVAEKAVAQRIRDFANGEF